MIESARRAMLLPQVRRLVEAARSERALLPASSPERQFYLGVEAAAEGMLHPELGASRSAESLDRDPSAFREGYLRASELLAWAATAPEPPQRLPLPEPPPSAEMQ